VGAGAKPFIAYSILSVTDYGVGDEVIYPNRASRYTSRRSAFVARCPCRCRCARRAISLSIPPTRGPDHPRTRLLILNSRTTHRRHFGRRDLEEIAAILRRHPEVWIYADEIYSRLVYQGEFASIASLPGMVERTIISDGASKTGR